MRLLVLICAVSGALLGGPITATFNFTFSGTVNSTAFTDAAVTITAVGDTGSNTGTFIMHPTSTTIAIAGFSLATVTGADYVGVNQGIKTIFFGSTSDLAQFFGPTVQSVPAPKLVGSNWATLGLNTSIGVVKVTDESGNATFQAVVGSSTAPTPEPATMWFAGVGLAMVVSRRLLRQ
jgi:hypothetical protein